MNKHILFEDLESDYLAGDYEKFVDKWERNDKIYTFNLTNSYDQKILEALVVSYSELNKPRRGIYYVNKFTSFVKKEKLTYAEYSEEFDFYYLAKASFYSQLDKQFSECKTLREYIGFGGKDSKLIKYHKEIEIIVLRLYRQYNLNFVYVFIALIVIDNVLKYLLHYTVSPLIMIVLMVVGLIWIGANFLSKTFSQKVLNLFIDIL